MANYIGSVKEVDHYIGNNLIVSKYIGETKYFDAYTEIEGNLPFSFKSRAEHNLKNYTVYGTVNGSGVETENLFDVEEITYNGYAKNNFYNQVSSNNICAVIKRFEPNTNYCITWEFNSTSTEGFYNQMRLYATSTIIGYVDSGNVINLTQEQIDSITNVIVYFGVGNTDGYYKNFTIVQGSTAPTSYIPFGYKIPVLDTSGVTENILDIEGVEEIYPATQQQRYGTEYSTPGYYCVKAFESLSTTYIYARVVQNNQPIQTWYVVTPTGLLTANVTLSEGQTLYVYDADISTLERAKQNLNATKTTVLFSALSAPTPPDHYIPYRYETTYNLYIGNTKLYKEEYLDYQEQKIYKRTENLWNKSFVVPGTINADGSTTTSEYYARYTDYIPLQEGETIGFLTPKSTGHYVAVYNSNYAIIDRVQVGVSTTGSIYTAISNTAYILPFFGGAGAQQITSVDDIASEYGQIPSSYIAYLQPTDTPTSFPSITTYKGENTLSSSETVGDVTIKGRIRPYIYGWHVDPSISDPTQAITYLGDAVGKTPAAMGSSAFNYGSWQDVFFMPKPCMVKSNGTVDYYLNPNDYTKKIDGTASDVDNVGYDGNAMMEWPLIWWKYEAGETEGEGYFYVSDVKVDDTYHCWCNINCDNEIVEHFYTAIYNGTGTDKLRSISGVALTSANGNGGTTYSQESIRALANNTTAKTEWFIDVWADRMLINGLLILMGKSLNSQAVFGRGLDTGGQTAKEAYITGSLNDKGMFWGDISAGTSGVKVFGMENWYSCAYHRTAGLIGLANGNTAYKMTYGTADGTTANGYNTTGDGYHINTVARPANNYVKSCKFGDFGYLPLSTTGGSASTYYTDYWYTNNSALTFALVGGYSSTGAVDGVSSVALIYGSGNALWLIAAALTLKPLAK